MFLKFHFNKKATMILSFKIWVSSIYLAVIQHDQLIQQRTVNTPIELLLTFNKCKPFFYIHMFTFIINTMITSNKKIAKCLKSVHFYLGLNKYYKAYIIIKHISWTIYLFYTHTHTHGGADYWVSDLNTWYTRVEYWTYSCEWNFLLITSCAIVLT